MTVRLMGIVLILTASSMGGIITAGVWKKRVLQLEAFHELAVHISRQIDGYLTPLQKIYAEYEDTELSRCGFLFALRKYGGVKALEECRSSLCISESDISELRAFFMGLGRHSAKEEARHCAYFEKQIGDIAGKAKKELAAKTRLCRGFGILFGIMLAVILI